MKIGSSINVRSRAVGYLFCMVTVLGMFTSCDKEKVSGPTAKALENTFGSGFGNDELLDVSIDQNGNIYVSTRTKIYKVSESGHATVLAGSNTKGTVDGQGTAARFQFIGGLTFDEDGNIYAPDSAGIRKITPVGLVTSLPITEPEVFRPRLGHPTHSGLVVRNQIMYFIGPGNRISKAKGASMTHFVGSETLSQGFKDGSGYNGELMWPRWLIWNPHEDNLVLADGGSLRKITLEDSTITTFTGGRDFGFRDGTLSEAMYEPINDVVIDRNGVYYLSSETRIRKITPAGQVTTLAGPKRTNGKDFLAGGIAVDPEARFLYVIDQYQRGTLIKIDLAKFQ